MKKKLLFVMGILIAICLSGCGLSEEKCSENIRPVMIEEPEKPLNGNWKFITKQWNNEVFQEVLAKELQAAAPQEGFILAYRLDKEGLYSDVFRTAFENWLSNLQTKVFSGEAEVDFPEYVDLIETYIANERYTNKYAAIIQCYPYNALKEFILKSCQPASTTDSVGSFYHENKDKYENEDYWYSPLDKKKIPSGELGTYHRQRTYQFYGDFALESESTYWWGTDWSDSNNKNYVNLYFKDRNILWREEEVNAFCRLMNGGKVYYAQKDKDYSIFIVQTDNIAVKVNNTFFLIQYK